MMDPHLSPFAPIAPIAFTSLVRSAQSGLPEGAGRELVLAHCTSCHGTAQIERSAGFGSAAEWQGPLFDHDQVASGAV